MPIISDWHRAKTRKMFFRVIRSTVSLFPAPSFVSTRMNVRRRANDKRLPSSFFHRVSTEFFPRSINRIKRDGKKISNLFYVRSLTLHLFGDKIFLFDISSYSFYHRYVSRISWKLCAWAFSRDFKQRKWRIWCFSFFFFFLDTNDRRKCRTMKL